MQGDGWRIGDQLTIQDPRIVTLPLIVARPERCISQPGKPKANLEKATEATSEEVLGCVEIGDRNCQSASIVVVQLSGVLCELIEGLE